MITDYGLEKYRAGSRSDNMGSTARWQNDYKAYIDDDEGLIAE